MFKPIYRWLTTYRWLAGFTNGTNFGLSLVYEKYTFLLIKCTHLFIVLHLLKLLWNYMDLMQ